MTDRQELADWAAKDPINRLKSRLLQSGSMTADEVQ